MTPELTALTLAALLQVVQFILFAIPANLELGTHFTSSPRDTAPPKALSLHASRLQRALNNHFEGLILFTIAVLVVSASNRSNTVTHLAGWAYLAARIAYVPAYAWGLAPWRSAIWGVGFVATIVMLLAVLI